MHVFLGALVLWAGDGPECGTQNTNKNAVARNSQQSIKTYTQIFKTFNNGSLGSRIDEERSEMRYVV